MSNYTTLIDDIENLSIISNSTSPSPSPTSSEFSSEFLKTDSPFPSPADPFDDYINVTDYTIVEIKSKNGTDTITVFEYMNLNPWLTYSLCAIAAIIVIVAIVAIIFWLKKHKTRIINETTDPVLTSNYQDRVGFLSCCTSCCSSKPRSSMGGRQNSASNLESYGRPALPQSAYQIERPKSQESYVIDTSNLAMYIDEIEDIPNREAPKGAKRELPKYRYQQYQTNS